MVADLAPHYGSCTNKTRWGSTQHVQAEGTSTCSGAQLPQQRCVDGLLPCVSYRMPGGARESP